MNNLFIYCDGGFGNRYNCLMGGLWLAHTLHLTPKVLWPQNNWCGAAWHDLFEPCVQLYDAGYDQILDSTGTINVIHENQFHRPITYLQSNNTNLAEIQAHMARLPEQHLFYFNSLIPAWMNATQIQQEIVKQVPFKSDLVRMAQDVIRTHAGAEVYLGIHMRKTDFGAHAASDLPFLNLVKSRPSQKVFVCSDDAETEKKFLQLPNVFVYEKTAYVEKLVQGDWNQVIQDDNHMQWPFNVNRSAASVQQAVVDLLILSHSQIVNTNSQSTFLHVAQLLQQSRRHLQA